MGSIDNFVALLEGHFGPQGKGKPFETFCMRFLTEAPDWAGFVNKVWLWKDWPGRWGADNGIDLIVENHAGEIWAVQAKCMRPDYILKKYDVDKFLAESGRPIIKGRLLLATCQISRKVLRTFSEQEKESRCYSLPDFRDSPFEFPSTLPEISTSKANQKPSPRQHQIEAVEACVKGLNDNDRGQLIMACGTGKTFTTLWIKEALGASRVLVLLPSLSLLTQTMREWVWAAKVPFRVLNVCSDATVASSVDDDRFVTARDAPFPVTTSVDHVREFLEQSGPCVVF